MRAFGTNLLSRTDGAKVGGGCGGDRPKRRQHFWGISFTALAAADNDDVDHRGTATANNIKPGRLGTIVRCRAHTHTQTHGKRAGGAAVV